MNQIQFGAKKYSASLIIEQDRQGQISSLTKELGDGYRLAVLATPADEEKKSVRLQYHVFQIENGQEKELARPRIIALLGTEASVEERDENKRQIYKLSVVAEEIAKR